MDDSELDKLCGEAASVATRVYGDGVSIHVQRYYSNGDCWIAEVRRDGTIVIKGKRCDFSANGDVMQTARIDAAKHLLASLRSLEAMHAPSIMQTETKRMVDEFSDLAHRIYPDAIAGYDSRAFEFYVRHRFDGTPILSETGATMLDAYNTVMAKLRAVAVGSMFGITLPKTIAASEATASEARTTGVITDEMIHLYDAEIRRVFGSNHGAMRITSATAIESFNACMDRLKSLPDYATTQDKFRAFEPWGGSFFGNAVRSITNTTPEQKALPTMTTPAPTPIMDTVKADAEAAAWRLAGSQLVKLTKEPLVAILSRHLGPGDDSMRARIAAFIDTEFGSALLAGVLSAGLTAMPTPPGSGAASINGQLARELRVRSMAATGDLIADVLMGPLRQVAVMYLAGAPTFPMALPDGADRLVVPSTVAQEVAK